MTRQEWVGFCLTFPDAYEDYPFDDDNWTVLRHRSNRKIFAMLYERGGQLFLNVKCEPMRAELLRGAYRDVTPGYHMNKEHWNTVLLGGDVPHDEICDMVAHSYEITRPKQRKKRGDAQ